MTTQTDTAAKAPGINLPWDLSEWIPKDQLLDLVKGVVDSLNWSSPELLEFLRGFPNFEPRALLCLLGFAYSTAVFESGQITELFYSTPSLLAMAPNYAPTVRAIGRFRRDHRGLLKWLLAQLFQEVFKQHFHWTKGLLPAGLKQYLRKTAVNRLDVARDMDRAAQGF